MHLLLGLKVVEQNGALLRILTPVLDDHTRAVDNLAGVALAVENTCSTVRGCIEWMGSSRVAEEKLTQTSPLAELLAIRDLDQGDLVLVAQSNDELLVSILLASLVQDAHVRLAAVESLGRLTQTTGKTVVDERDAEDTAESVQDGHLALGGGIGRNLNLLLDLGLVIFYVRLLRVVSALFVPACLHNAFYALSLYAALI